MQIIITLGIAAVAISIAFSLGYKLGDAAGQTKSIDWCLDIMEEEERKLKNELLANDSRRGAGTGETTGA